MHSHGGFLSLSLSVFRYLSILLLIVCLSRNRRSHSQMQREHLLNLPPNLVSQSLGAVSILINPSVLINQFLVVVDTCDTICAGTPTQY